MVSLLTPHHVQLVNACYPPSAALLTAGPDYKPNVQELSRLTYYASNRPSKISKLGSVLQKRVTADVRRSQAGNLRARAQLLISLNIWKALLNECRRDISLLSSSLMSSLDSCFASLANDLEIAATVATVFTAWTTYSTGQLLGVDMALTRDCLSTLRHFADMSVVDARNGDYEDRNRFRLIGLAALGGTITSETLYNSSSQFKPQVSTIMPSLLSNIFQLNLRTLETEAENIKTHPSSQSPFVADSRTRPVVERRAASIHVHVTGESGPTEKDIANATLRALANLFGQSSVGQIGSILQALFDALGIQGAWNHNEHCCWLARKAVEWTQYQYRFAVPSRMVERLSEAQGDSSPTDLHMTLANMVKAVLTSSTPLVNMSTSDIMSNLTSLILRRVSLSSNDALLPVLVECVGALGTHLYYADQIHDLACELVSRIINIESIGVSGRGRVYTHKEEEERAMALRCFSTALAYLMESSHKYLQSTSSPKDGEVISDTASAYTARGSTSQKPTDEQSPMPSFPRRSRVPPEVFQETLALLCDVSFEVRSDYANVLQTFLRTEVSPEMSVASDGGEKPINPQRPSIDDQPQRKKSVRLAVHDSITVNRFLHALHASLYILATCPRLGLPSTANPSPSHSVDEVDVENPLQVNVIPSTPMRNETSSALSESNQDTSQTSQHSHSSRRRTAMGQKLSKLRKLLERNRRPVSTTSEPGSCAVLNDFTYILSILLAIQEHLPSKGLLLCVPMLLALQQWSTSGPVGADAPDDVQRRRAIVSELTAKVWLKIADNWECDELRSMAESAISSSSCIPAICSRRRFPESDTVEPLSSALATTISPSDFDSQAAVSLLVVRRNVQVATGLDEETLRDRLGSPWTAEDSLDNSVARTTTDSSKSSPLNPILRITPGLMAIENLSMQSLARSTRGVGVNDLRDALEGRVNMSNVMLQQHKAPSVSSLGAHTLSAASGDSHNASQYFRANKMHNRQLNGNGQKEVRDVLDKLGIGTKKGPNLFKASLSTRQKGKGTEL